MLLLLLGSPFLCLVLRPLSVLLVRRLLPLPLPMLVFPVLLLLLLCCACCCPCDPPLLGLLGPTVAGSRSMMTAMTGMRMLCGMSGMLLSHCS